ncbi:hypothetical protein AAJ72_03320 [Citromicrobium sp. RCC1885]|nr:hypothetical protein WG75_03675 [Citromicrobium sp. WPS32]KPM24779.1 hypothetical protein AAJ72_03320 [Citromicrobium sp. RCC1885]KPM28022.1 hypothetical protein AAJ74_04065 [Citromicrobium sp. RCC1878]
MGQRQREAQHRGQEQGEPQQPHRVRVDAEPHGQIRQRVRQAEQEAQREPARLADHRMGMGHGHETCDEHDRDRQVHQQWQDGLGHWSGSYLLRSERPRWAMARAATTPAKLEIG